MPPIMPLLIDNAADNAERRVYGKFWTIMTIMTTMTMMTYIPGNIPCQSQYFGVCMCPACSCGETTVDLPGNLYQGVCHLTILFS